tara:strand:+ start:388 stop:843 length:456 start_codon:yes stop_codon:yes gene_type:complete
MNITTFLTEESKSENRLNWNDYFINFALLTSLRSPSPKLKVGSVITKNNRIISTGYNGYPSNSPHQSINRDGHEINTIHAEQNAICFAARSNISIENSTIYVTHYPCINCAKVIIASGIKTVYYLNDYKNDEVVTTLFLQSGICVKKISYQ